MIKRSLATVAFAAAVLVGITSAAQTPEAGRQAFEGRCAGCHGMDGAGIGTSASIVNPALSRAATASALRDLIRTGIPGTGMPAFPIPDAELDNIVSFVETLRARSAKPAAPGPAGGRGGGAPAPRAVSVRMKDGRVINGLARYETLFDLGVHGSDGRFHSISKSQAAGITFDVSPVPSTTVTVGAGVPFTDIATPKPG